MAAAIVVALAVLLTGAAEVRAAAPPNDNFVSAQTLAPSSSGSLSTATTEATREPDEPDHAGNEGGASIWFSWTPSFSGAAQIDTVGSTFDTLLAVYGGASIGSLTRLASNDDLSGDSSSSRVCFQVNAGSTYRLAVDGFAGSTGDVDLSWGAKTDSEPCATLPPQISGALPEPRVGGRLSASAGTFAGSGPTRSWQWLRCTVSSCQPIEEATGSSYVVAERDAGRSIRVSEENSNGTTIAMNLSDPTGVAVMPVATSPRGRVYWLDRFARSMFADGRDPLVLGFQTGRVAPSPDGRLLAWSDINGDLTVSTANNSARLNTLVKGESPVWAPDGSRLAFVTGSGGASAIKVLDLFTGDVATVRSFAPGTGFLGYDWSPDGRQILLGYVDFALPTYFDIAVMSADGRGPLTRLTTGSEADHSPAWSPTGDKILFIRGLGAGSGQEADLWVMNADGSGQTKLVDGEALKPVERADWSPDGTSIVFSWVRIDANFDRHADLLTIPATGGVPTVLIDAGNEQGSWTPTWAPLASYQLDVEAVGSGGGVVKSVPAGISCSQACEAIFEDPTTVTLTAVASPGSTFVGWAGDCSDDPCSVVMNGDRFVFAVFEPIVAAPPPGGGGGGGGGGGDGPDVAISLVASSLSPLPNSAVEIRAAVANTSSSLSARGLRATIALPVDATLLGPPAYETGSGCTGTTTLSCNLDFLSAGATSTVRFAINTGGAGVKQITAATTMSIVDPNLANNTAALTLNVTAPAPLLPPSVGSPQAPSVKVVTGNSRANTLNGTAGRDLLRGLGGNDKLFGRGGEDTLLGGPGDDRLVGGPGRDKLDGGAGADAIEARDGARDTVVCGPGRDTVSADRQDAIGKSCEVVRRR